MNTDQGEKVKGQVTRSYNVSAVRTLITKQRLVVSTSYLVKIFIVRYATRDTLSRSVAQLDPKVEIWRTFSLSNAKINRKRCQIAEIAFPIRKSGSKNQMVMSEF